MINIISARSRYREYEETKINMQKLSIKNLASKIKNNELNEASLLELRTDERTGIKRLLKQYDKQVEAEQKLETEYLQLVAFENSYRTDATTLIAGVDEAGRGPLAGPVVAAAVILPSEFKLLGLTDSKQVTEKDRNQFYEEIINHAVSYHISIIDNQTIDQINILEATKRTMRESLLGLDVTPNIGLIDAVKLTQIPFKTEAIIKGDEKSLAIAAASILAKVTRDRLMCEIDKEFPEYAFKQHKGYGTKIHLEALEKYGPTKYHRLTFSPVRAVISH